MSSKCVVAGLVAANFALARVGATPIRWARDDPPSSSSPSDAATTSSSWLPDLYISPPEPTKPTTPGVFVDIENEQLLVSNPGGPANPTPTLVFLEPTPSSKAPMVQLPVAPEPSTSTPPVAPTTTYDPVTSTIFSTVWITQTEESTVIPSSSSTAATSMPTEAPVSSSASLTSLTPSSSSSGPPAPVATGNPSTPVLATYYADWTSSDLLPEQIDFGRFDWVDFAFAVPTADFNLTFTEDDSVSLLTRLVKLAHTANPPKRVKLSVGGWDGSKYFSAAVSTPTNIATFVGNIVAAVKTYGVDGIDIDWEYPGVQGAGGNGVSPSDTTNFLSFLQQLRSQLGPSALLTAAVATSPFHLSSANTTEAASVFSSFGQVLDYILIMNYDVSDATASSPGSNAPLLSHGPSCPSSQDVVSAELAIDQWTAAGFPANKILLGVPSYGYMLSSSATTLSETPGRRRKRTFPRSRRQLTDPSAILAAMSPGPVIPPNDLSTIMPSVPSSLSPSSPNLNLASSQPGVANVVTDSSGQVQFNYLVQVGALVKNGTTPSSPSGPPSSFNISPPQAFSGTGSYTRYWDACSSTPYLVSQSLKKVIPYDDPASLQLKAAYTMQRGLAGVNMFDVHGDTAAWDLVDGLRRGLSSTIVNYDAN